MPRVFWTKEESARLMRLVGESTAQELVAEFPGKSWQAIKAKARRLGFSPFQGSWTLTRMIEETGYNWKQLGKAREALGQVWAESGAPRSAKRGGHRPRFVITDEQVQELLAHLATATRRRWGTSRDGASTWDCCQVCGATGGTPMAEHDYGGWCRGCREKAARRKRWCPECGATLLTVGSMIRNHRKREYQREWARKQRSDPGFLVREAAARRAWRTKRRAAAAAEVGGGGVLVQLGPVALRPDGGERAGAPGDRGGEGLACG